MKKLALASSIVAALAATATMAATAGASDLGSQVPSNLPVLENSDWNGHGSHHCNNLAGADYYTPGGEAFVGDTGSKPGDSWYTVNPDPSQSTGGASCSGGAVLVATGYYNGDVTGVHNPSCNPSRNPCDGKSAIYVVVAGISAGQRGNTP